MRRVVAATAGLSIAAVLVAPVRADAEVAVERLAGADRYTTAATVSRAAFPDGAPVVYLTSGTSYADALAAAPVAAVEGGPVLLAEGAVLPTATRAELERLRPAAVVVVGGTSAISDAVATAAGATERIAGADRYDTAAALAARLHPDGGPLEAAFVASGEAFPDALSAAAPAAQHGAPVLLTRRTDLPPATSAALARLRPQTTTVLGGAGAVDLALNAVIAEGTGGAVGRFEGRDRWATSAAVSASAFGSGAPVAYLASGDAFADGLAGAVLAGRTGGPVLLSPAPCLPDRVAGELARLAPSRIVVLGGEDAVGQAAATGAVRCPRPHDPRPVSREDPMTVLVLGDSLATEPAHSLASMFEYFGGGAVAIKANVPGTGLNRPDVFDWLDYAPRTIAEVDPDVVMMIIGANDTDEMTTYDGRWVPFASDEWRVEYLRRVAGLMDALAGDGRLVVWASEPVMGRAPLNSDVGLISDLMAGVVGGREISWLDTRPLFSAPDGTYVNNGWRLDDEVHFTPEGGNRLAGAVFEVIGARWGGVSGTTTARP